MELAGCCFVGGGGAEPGSVIVVDVVDVPVDDEVPVSVSEESEDVAVVLAVEDVEEVESAVPSPADCCPAGVHS